MILTYIITVNTTVSFTRNILSERHSIIRNWKRQWWKIGVMLCPKDVRLIVQLNQLFRKYFEIWYHATTLFSSVTSASLYFLICTKHSLISKVLYGLTNNKMYTSFTSNADTPYTFNFFEIINFTVYPTRKNIIDCLTFF